MMIDRAATILRNGGLVAFPTETVYGLGADATNADAVAQIFAVKGRPATNPLIVHVADAEVAKRYVADWPAAAQGLAERFWPGPLTLVLPKTSEISSVVTAGKSTVGIRIPAHPVALELLRSFDGPIAAPSANRSNHVSPTTARHVRDDLGDAVDLILDGGPCTVGIESTVLDLSQHPPRILRPGAVTREQIEAVIGRVDQFQLVVDARIAAPGPGMQERHYAPHTPAYRFERTEWQAASTALMRRGPKPACLLHVGEKTSNNLDGSMSGMLSDLQLPADPAGAGKTLYALLRHADSLRATVILVEMPPDTPAWAAVRDRLIRATRTFSEFPG